MSGEEANFSTSSLSLDESRQYTIKHLFTHLDKLMCGADKDCVPRDPGPGGALRLRFLLRDNKFRVQLFLIPLSVEVVPWRAFFLSF